LSKINSSLLFQKPSASVLASWTSIMSWGYQFFPTGSLSCYALFFLLQCFKDASEKKSDISRSDRI